MKNLNIRQDAIKSANISQFRTEYTYDHKSFEDGFYEGATEVQNKIDIILNDFFLIAYDYESSVSENILYFKFF